MEFIISTSVDAVNINGVVGSKTHCSSRPTEATVMRYRTYLQVITKSLRYPKMRKKKPCEIFFFLPKIPVQIMN